MHKSIFAIGKLLIYAANKIVYNYEDQVVS